MKLFYIYFMILLPWVPEVFSCVRREFSVLAEGRHIFGRRPKLRAAKKPETALEKSLAPRVWLYRSIMWMGKAVKNVRIDLKQYFSTLETKSKLSETVRRDGEKQLANSCPPRPQ